MKKILLLLSFSFFIFLAILPAKVDACSCGMETPDQNFEKADVVFTGTVLSVTKAGREFRVDMLVDTAYKGTSKSRLTITTSHDSGLCGYTFAGQTRYLVYAKEVDRKINVTLCDGTTRYTGVSQETLLDLEARGGKIIGKKGNRVLGVNRTLLVVGSLSAVFIFSGIIVGIRMHDE
jgi:hypothetical protein